jgi:hypothetical protein
LLSDGHPGDYVFDGTCAIPPERAEIDELFPTRTEHGIYTSNVRDQPFIIYFKTIDDCSFISYHHTKGAYPLFITKHLATLHCTDSFDTVFGMNYFNAGPPSTVDDLRTGRKATFVVQRPPCEAYRIMKLRGDERIGPSEETLVLIEFKCFPQRFYKLVIAKLSLSTTKMQDRHQTCIAQNLTEIIKSRRKLKYQYEFQIMYSSADVLLIRHRPPSVDNIYFYKKTEKYKIRHCLSLLRPFGSNSYFATNNMGPFNEIACDRVVYGAKDRGRNVWLVSFPFPHERLPRTCSGDKRKLLIISKIHSKYIKTIILRQNGFVITLLRSKTPALQIYRLISNKMKIAPTNYTS